MKIAIMKTPKTMITEYITSVSPAIARVITYRVKENNNCTQFKVHFVQFSVFFNPSYDYPHMSRKN